MQVKCACTANDPTYILYGCLNQNEEHLGICLMNMQLLFDFFLSVKQNFEISPAQKIHCPPQRDQKMPGGI